MVFYGVGGIGKSKLRKELCRMHEDENKEGITFYLDLNAADDRNLGNGILNLVEEDYSKEYLDKAGIADKGIASAIIKSSKGYPFLLYLSLETYANIKNSGKEPTEKDFTGSYPEIIERFIYNAEEELKRMEEFQKAQAEIEKKNDAKAVSQKMFKVV